LKEIPHSSPHLASILNLKKRIERLVQGRASRLPADRISKRELKDYWIVQPHMSEDSPGISKRELKV